MTNPITTLEGQQAEVIKRLPNAVAQIKRLLDATDTDELYRVLSERLASGHKVFGSKMFEWEAGDLWGEGIEEFVDGLIYLVGHLWVADNGPLRNPEVPESGDRVRIKDGLFPNWSNLEGTLHPPAFGSPYSRLIPDSGPYESLCLPVLLEEVECVH